MRRTTIGLLFLAVVMLIPGHVRGDDLGGCKEQFEFAEALFAQDDFYRAIGEYKRLIFLCPAATELCEKAYFKIGVCYFRAKEWQKAIDVFTPFLGSFTDSPMAGEAMYLKGMCEKNLSLHSRALRTFDYIIQTEIGERRAKAIYQSALILVDMENWKRAGEMFSQVPEESVLYNSAGIFSEGLENITNLPHKSPVVAGTLAAILPGAG
ncbi:MAG TPA: tetratricopeptide repeat protein, partial [Syntrophales bacterium]|nr:tetratricopeptide repeat protein [Syntrophales bacterium]